jgi:hypothetical protein
MKSDNQHKINCELMDEVKIEWIENQALDEIDEQIDELKQRKEYLLKLFKREE